MDLGLQLLFVTCKQVPWLFLLPPTWMRQYEYAIAPSTQQKQSQFVVLASSNFQDTDREKGKVFSLYAGA